MITRDKAERVMALVGLTPGVPAHRPGEDEARRHVVLDKAKADMQSADVNVRRTCLRTIHPYVGLLLKRQDVVQVIRTRLEDSDPEVRQLARQALDESGVVEPTVQHAVLEKPLQKVLEGVASAVTKGVEAVVVLLRETFTVPWLVLEPRAVLAASEPPTRVMKKTFGEGENLVICTIREIRCHDVEVTVECRNPKAQTAIVTFGDKLQRTIKLKMVRGRRLGGCLLSAGERQAVAPGRDNQFRIEVNG